jgi:2-oxoglutarate ferredoxin oxidoreductase subunit gamma
MPRVEMTIAGVGGQGSILAGVILGEAAVSHNGLYATQTSAYSSELRGGFAAAWLVIDDEPVIYPRVTAPDVLAAQAQDSIERFASVLKPGGRLIYDSDMISALPEGMENTHGIAATGIARGELGAPIVANMVMLGAICEVTGLVSKQALEKAVAANVPESKIELNLKAFNMGMDRVE